MWICNRCQAENRDSLSACEACGALRSAGRFGSAPVMGDTARTPRVTAAREPVVRPAAQAAPAAPTVPAARRSYAPPPPEPPARGPLRVFAKLVGGLLLILLPLLCAALCVQNQAALREALLPLLLPAETDEAIRTLCFWVMAAAAILVSMLPGLWTILLAGPGKKRRGGKAA